MTEKLNIVQSTTEPNKRNIWLKDNELKKFGAKGWSTIGGSNTGDGGTSTDKDALDIYLDSNTTTIIIDDKVYIPKIDGLTFTITNKELHDRLYNFLINTYRPVYLKSVPTNDNYIFGICTGGIVDKVFVNLLFLAGGGIMAISVCNK